MDQKIFNSASGLKLTSGEVVEEIGCFMAADRGRRYKIVVGTDSGIFTDSSTDFVTALVVHRLGNGGRYFWHRATLNKFHTLRERIIHEALTSVEIAKEIILAIQDSPAFSSEDFKNLIWEFEVHVDIGEKGRTKTMIQEVVAMVRASNFEVRVKPESYAASSIADRYA